MSDVDESVDSVKIETNGLSAFQHNLRKWFWKLAYTSISAKVLVTLLAESIATYLVLHGYIVGQQWADVTVSIVVAFIGARVSVPLIQALGEAIGKRGVAKEEGDD